MKRIACSDLLEGGPPGEDATLEGPELVRLYWTLKQREKDIARRERYWSSISDGLTHAYEELEAKTKELQALRDELERVNAGLAARVAEQVTEIMRQASDVEALEVQLKERVKERSRELRLALARAEGGGEARAGSLAPGAIIGGRARIIAKIGEGAMGSVYEAEDLLTKRQVALKLLRATDPSSLHRFVAEAEAASAVAHPGIVRTVHVDVAEDGTPYHLMDLVRGVTLRRHLETARVRFGEAARIGASVAAALAAAHARGIVHRDIKPENILLSIEPPGVRVLDFGVSKHLSAEGPGSAELGHPIVGTPGYMAPDQILPAGEITPAVDVYSLGVVLFELIAGRRPFQKPRIEDVLVAHLYAPPPELGGPPKLAAIVRACLEKKPVSRPTAPELADLLERFAGEVEAPSADAIGEAAGVRDRDETPPPLG
ncbi:MAG: protein kinase [Deltaproteobacteria bacterium]|nr:protein kinase [Deltaproteobacteria bacterium]